MSNKTSRRLKQMHYDTAWELCWIYEPYKGCQEAPRGIKQRASIWLKRLVQEAGINAEGLTRRGLYLESIRALISAGGHDDSYSALMVQGVAKEWRELRYRERTNAAQTTVSSAQTFTAAFDWSYFGIHRGDELICDTNAPVKTGGLVLYRSQIDDKTYFARVCMVTQETVRLAGEYSEADDYPLSAVVTICTHLRHGDDCNRKKIEALRARLAKMNESDDITDHANRFKLEREIYDLEHWQEADAETDTDEWPDEIAV